MTLSRLKLIKESIPVSIRRIAAYWLPLPPRVLSPNITELVRHEIQRSVRLETYWVNASLGSGPAASLYVFDDEVMRFDCFGGTDGHFHVNRKQTRAFPNSGQARLFFPAGSIEENIERSAFELCANLPYCLLVNASKRIRKMRIEESKLEEAAGIMKAEMLSLLEQKVANNSKTSERDCR
jgi:hypothetical protein